MEELEALNLLLRAIGSSPVNSLTTTHPDASNAKATLDRARIQLQLTGWWFNIDYDVAFTPDTTGQIVVSQDITKVILEDKYIVQRGRKLYNKSTQTYVFTGEVLARRIQYVLPWETLPASMQLYATYYAAAQFVRDTLGDAGKVSEFLTESVNARLDVKKDDLEQGQYNSFDAGRVLRARQGVRPYRSNF